MAKPTGRADTMCTMRCRSLLLLPLLAASACTWFTSQQPVTIQMPDLPALEAQAASLAPGEGCPVRMVWPEGSALDFTVDEVRIGRVVDIELEAENADAAHAEVARMCEQLLANPLIESFEIEFHE